jgi:hypothetical protein
MNKPHLIGTALLIVAAAYLAVFALPELIKVEELHEAACSPGGEWEYVVRYVDTAGAAGSAYWQVDVQRVEDQTSNKVVYFATGSPPRVWWVDDHTLEVKGKRIDVREAIASRRKGDIVMVLIIAIPTALLALAGVIVLVREHLKRRAISS